MAYGHAIADADYPSGMLAHRLTEIVGHRVLLLEAGPREWHPLIRMAAELAKLIGGRHR